MKIRIGNNQMEEIEGINNEYPYAYHYVDMSKTQVPWHWHEALEFGYVVEGTVKVSTTAQHQVFSKGEAFFINSNVLATMANLENCIIESHLFHPVLLAGHFKSVFETKYLNPVIQNRKLDLFAIRPQNDKQKQIIRNLKQLALYQKQQDVEFQTRNLLSEIWLLMLDELKNAQINSAQPKNQERILNMVAFIQQNYAEKLTLEDIARSAAVSTRECLRCFRTLLQCSPMEYLIEYRVQTAKKLLESTDAAVGDIALQTGWQSSAYFAKMFKQISGNTPIEYRKKHHR